MTNNFRTTASENRAIRAEIVRAHETPHDARLKRGLSQQNQCRAAARNMGENHLVGGGIYALLRGRACELDSYSTHDRTIGVLMGEAA